MRRFPRSLGLLGTAFVLAAASAAAPARAQQPVCTDLDRLDQRIAALESGTISPPPTAAELGGLRAMRQAAVRLGQAGNAEACAAQVRSGLAMARGVEAPHALPADDLDEIKLFGPQGEDIGAIDDVLLDPASGRIAYAVVEMGGFLGLGQRKVPVPWGAFTANPHGEGLVLNLPKDRLKGAPQLSESDKRSVADRQWAMAVHTYYGVPPYWMHDAAALPPGEAAGSGGDAVGRLNQQVQQLSQEVTRLNQELMLARGAPSAAAPAAGGSAPADAGSGTSGAAPQAPAPQPATPQQ